MPNWREVPDWKYGDILTVDSPTDPSDHRTTRAMFLRWEYRADFNPAESVFVAIVVKPNPDRMREKAGQIIRPYCGWWMPE